MIKLIKYSAVWCPPCALLTFVWNKVIEKYKDNIDIKFIKVDIDQDPELAAKYNITSVPTIVFEKDGVVKNSIVGLVNEQTILNAIQELMR